MIVAGMVFFALRSTEKSKKDDDMSFAGVCTNKHVVIQLDAALDQAVCSHTADSRQGISEAPH